MAQAQAYYTPTEDALGFIAANLEKGLQSEHIGLKVKEKVANGSL
jgi:hypothetical protein